MKILHILSQAPDFTGSGKYIQAVMKAASAEGHTNFLVAGVQDNFVLDEDLISPERRVFVRFNGEDLDFPIPGMSDVMPYQSSIFSKLTDDQLKNYRRAFEAAIKEASSRFSPDIIHTHHLWIVSSIARQLLPDIPVVTTCHGTCLRQYVLCPHIGRDIEGTIRKIDRVMALSIHQKQEISKIYGIPEAAIDLVGGGFDDNLFSFAKKEVPPPVEILYAGKLSITKGVPWLLRSLKKLTEHASGYKNSWHLSIAGEGSGNDKIECLRLAEELGSRVTVCGALDHLDLSELMKRAHIFILPSFFEGVPLVLMEALACGCRLITTSLPGTIEVLSGCNIQSLISAEKNPDAGEKNRDAAVEDPGKDRKLARVALRESRNPGDTPIPKSDIGADTGSDNTETAIEHVVGRNSMISIIELPELETIDRPYEKDIESLERLLTEKIAEILDEVTENPQPDPEATGLLTSCYTWEQVFSRIGHVYEKALGAKHHSTPPGPYHTLNINILSFR